MDNNIIHTGKVVFYNTEKAYGFINDYITNKDLFVHRTGLKDSIKMDDEVTFGINRNEKGPFATEVRVINKYKIIIDKQEYDGNKNTRR
jgi:CspA family cold shock protein